MQHTHVNWPCYRGSAHFALPGLLLLFVLLGLSAGPIHADELRLKNGHQLRGRVLSDNGKQILLQVPEGKMWIRKSRVLSILRLDPRGTLLDECERRIRGGNPGSAIPFLRTQYLHSPGRIQILPLYRESLLSEIEKYLELDEVEKALELWEEYRTLPGRSARDLYIQEKIYREKDLLLKMEQNIHLALEMDLPVAATRRIRDLLVKFPSERRKWENSLSRNLLEAGRRAHDAGNFSQAATFLIDAVILEPALLTRARSAIVHCATMGQGLAMEQASQLLPQEPALDLAAARFAEISGNGSQQAVHLDNVRGQVGEEIYSKEIRMSLAQRASQELAGAPPPQISLEQYIDLHQQRFWNEWNLPGNPPPEIEIQRHENLDAMQKVLGSSTDPARLTVEMNYGRIVSETLHVIPTAPFLDQDDLPRELFRNNLPRIVGTHGWLPPWLEEGLCSISRGELARMRDLRILKRAHSSGSLPNIADLLKMDQSVEDELYRATCGSLVEWLISDIPAALLPDLLLQWSEEGLEQSLSTVTGADTLHELQQDWIRGKIIER